MEDQDLEKNSTLLYCLVEIRMTKNYDSDSDIEMHLTLKKASLVNESQNMEAREDGILSPDRALTKTVTPNKKLDFLNCYGTNFENEVQENHFHNDCLKPTKMNQLYMLKPTTNQSSISADDCHIKEKLEQDFATQIAGVSISSRRISRMGIRNLYTTLAFLSNQEIITSFFPICRDFRISTDCVNLWKYLKTARECHSHPIYLFKRLDLVSSKKGVGELSRVLYRQSGEVLLLRIFNMIVQNGGFNNGFPTSVLRELTGVESFIGNHSIPVTFHCIHQNKVFVAQKFYSYSLRSLINERSQIVSSDKQHKLSSTSTDAHGEELKAHNSSIRHMCYQLFHLMHDLRCQGVMHREFTPENLLFDTKEGILKINNFRGSRLHVSSLRDNTVLPQRDYHASKYQLAGLRYRAPEILLRTERYGSEVDIWTTGLIFAELCLGESLLKDCENKNTELDILIEILKIIGTPLELREMGYPSWSNPINEERPSPSWLNSSREAMFQRMSRLER